MRRCKVPLVRPPRAPGSAPPTRAAPEPISLPNARRTPPQRHARMARAHGACGARTLRHGWVLDFNDLIARVRDKVAAAECRWAGLKSPAIGEDADGAGALGRRQDGRGRSPSVASSEGSAREGSRRATPRDGVQRLRARALGRSVSPATTSSAARWRAFMTRRLPDIMDDEGMSSNDAMSRVAGEWMEAKEDDSQLLLLAEAGIEDPCAPAGSEDGTPAAGRKRLLRSASPHSPRYKGFAQRK